MEPTVQLAVVDLQESVSCVKANEKEYGTYRPFRCLQFVGLRLPLLPFLRPSSSLPLFRLYLSADRILQIPLWAALHLQVFAAQYLWAFLAPNPHLVLAQPPCQVYN